MTTPRHGPPSDNPPGNVLNRTDGGRIIGLAMRSTLPFALLVMTALLASGTMLAAADAPKEGDLAPDFT
ncbi:MAG: hypothetical protein V3U35_05865, partial [Candidatus Neomarinimicrobiota bacterium]